MAIPTATTFMYGLDFLNLDLRYYRYGLLAKLVLLVYLDSNHSQLAQTTTFAGVPTWRHIFRIGRRERCLDSRSVELAMRFRKHGETTL